MTVMEKGASIGYFGTSTSSSSRPCHNLFLQLQNGKVTIEGARSDKFSAHSVLTRAYHCTHLSQIEAFPTEALARLGFNT